MQYNPDHQISLTKLFKKFYCTEQFIARLTNNTDEVRNRLSSVWSVTPQHSASTNLAETVTQTIQAAALCVCLLSRVSEIREL